MIKNDYLSVIIPYYNSKKWCDILLNKLIAQKISFYPKTEIILIDDCSTEDTTWLNKYKEHIIIIKNETNKGVSYCRNIGLDRSTGDYIQFVDSDDDITNDFLKVIYKNIRQGYDYLLYRWIVYGKITEGDIPPESIKWNKAVWGYTFTRNFIGNERFNENKNYLEDKDWLQRVLAKGGNRYVIDIPIYIYNLDNENSICHLLSKGKISTERK